MGARAAGTATALWTRASARVAAAVRGRALALRGAPERGDVPGWVLVTVMTAGLVIGLWAIAGPALEGMFEEAMASVTGP